MPFCSIRLTAPKPTKLPTILNTLGDHIKKRRLELGLYQAEVAEILEVTEPTVTNWEKNRTNPTLRTLPKIIGFLGNELMLNDASTLGEVVLRYRKTRGITQKKLAIQIGIDPTTLGRLERNGGRCFDVVLEKVTAFLNRRISGEGVFE